jgi:sugar transferase (PEP-CTERM/EpsH1 system associated)
VELYRGFASAAKVHAITNGVDLDYFQPAEPVAAEDGCVFVGALDYPPNVDAARWFCREVWPRLHRRHPGTRLRLVGRQPVDAIWQLAEVGGVEVVGQVPDVRPYLVRSAVVVAPLRIARGVQNKVLEGMAMGKPVVASPQVVSGLKSRHDIPIRLASSPAEWMEWVGRLLESEPLRRQLGAAGRHYVERHHEWERCLEPLGRLLGLDDNLVEV